MEPSPATIVKQPRLQPCRRWLLCARHYYKAIAHQTLWSLSTMISKSKITSDYDTIKELGEGTFGCVTLAQYKHSLDSLIQPNKNYISSLMRPLPTVFLSNQHSMVAIKTMKVKDVIFDRLREVKFIRHVGAHPNLVQIYNIVEDADTGHLHIIMEPAEFNLHQYLKGRNGKYLSTMAIKLFSSQLLCAIKHIHEYGFMHRDVKPENILLTPISNYYGGREFVPSYRRVCDTFNLKLADYGLARLLHSAAKFSRYVLTRWYRAPELFLRLPDHDQAVDVWALGCVCAEIANVFPIFPGRSELEMYSFVAAKIGSPTAKTRGPGGNWDGARELLTGRGWNVGQKSSTYTSMHELIHHPRPEIRDQLSELLECCLQWDPEQRDSAELLTRLSLFEWTLARMTLKKMLKADTRASIRFEHAKSQNASAPLTDISLSSVNQNRGVTASKVQNSQT